MDTDDKIYAEWENVMTVAIRNGDLTYTEARELSVEMILSQEWWETS